MLTIYFRLNMMSVLSIDIGIKHLGWALIERDKMSMGIFTIDDKNKKSSESTVLYRCKRISEFFGEFETPTYIVIERQVNNNTMAMELMYAIVMHAMSIIDSSNICIFNPALKFTFNGEEYSTKNKAHKKKSILMAREYLQSNHPEMITTFDSFDKKDDIADSLNQALTFLKIKNIA